MSLPICPMIQHRFYVGNENIAQTSKAEGGCKIDYYFSDLIIKLQKLE
jgi:hypothetical protein